ncbi:MAG: HAD-IC family P-type ATPase [Gaiellales bacterium]
MSAAAAEGLTSAQVAERRRALGEPEPTRTSIPLRAIIRRNVFTLINLITLGFLVLILIAGAWKDALFAGVIAINAVIGIVQEVRAKRTLDRLALLIAPRATVRRDGTTVEILAEEVVPDDIVELQPGDQVVADGEVIEARGLAIDESILTGEADHVSRRPGDAVYSGAYCAAGAGVYRVTATGASAYANRLTDAARQATDQRSPLQLDIDRLLRALLLSMIPLSVALIVAFRIHATNFQQAAETATAGLISVVPEGLILLTSITFALGAVKIGRAGALVQRLNAVESLAGVDTICVDKTGTLTDGSLRLTDVVAAPERTEDGVRRLLGRLAASAEIRSGSSDAIAAAIPSAPEPVRAELPFSSQWKWSGVQLDDGAIVLGAPEVLGAGPLAQAVAAFQEQRGRVLVVGTAQALPPIPEDEDATPQPVGFEPAGIVVLAEQMRADAADVVGFFRAQGVDLKVISGDAPRTVEAVAEAAGFGDVTAMSGADLPMGDLEAMADVAEAHSVFGRITPEQKRELVDALRRRGRYVAMIGDGVNDVPAMKTARMAIALGSGSQIAKGVSDMVLLNGSFSSLPAGVAEGRRILANIRRVAKLFVVKSAFAATLILTIGVAGAAYPLLPRHLSLAGAFTVGIPAFVLAVAPSVGLPTKVPFLRDLLKFSVPGGIVNAIGVLAAYGIVRSMPGHDLVDARSAALLVLVLLSYYLILLLEDEAVEQSHVRAWGVGVLMAFLVAGIVLAYEIPFVADFFAIRPPDFTEWLVILGSVAIGIGILGVLGFRAPLFVRMLFQHARVDD